MNGKSSRFLMTDPGSEHATVENLLQLTLVSNAQAAPDAILPHRPTSQLFGTSYRLIQFYSGYTS
jgi:hypothetical protein